MRLHTPGSPESAARWLALACALCLAPAARADCRTCAPALWERLELGSPPPARLDASLAADPTRQRVLLFGGRGRQGCLGDLWVLDLASKAWRQVEGVGPSPRSGASLIVEPSGRLVLFGGYQSDAVGRIQLLNDLWIHSPEGGWSREYAPGPPTPRAWHAALVADGRMLVFGGFARPAGSPGAYLQDVWTLELTEFAWRRIATDGGPLMAGRAALAWRQAEQQLEVFGRQGIPVPATIGFWRLDLNADRWAEPQLVPGLPLDFSALGPAATDGRVVALRGPDFHSPAWEITSVTPGSACCHHEVGAGPAGGEGLACVAEPGRPGAWLCFGGAREATLSDVTWRLQLPGAEAKP